MWEAHAQLAALREAKGHLEVHLRNKFSMWASPPTPEGCADGNIDAQSLTLKWSPGLGYFCHAKGKDINATGSMPSISSSRTTRSFLHPEWSKLGERIGLTRIAVRAEEKFVFQRILKKVILQISDLRTNASALDELDVLAGFAELAKEKNLRRPILRSNISHKIVGGRHITVEAGLGELGSQFVGNDCFVGTNDERVWLVTGPNMAGKSTFLRQNALISILAQTGSFVPADHAELGIVDKVFSRVCSPPPRLVKHH